MKSTMTYAARREFLSHSSQLLLGAATVAAHPLAIAKGADMSLTELSAVGAVAAMRKGDIKAEEYAGALLAQAAKLEGLNAFRTLNNDTVLASARRADKARASGKALGVLHGLPIPVKDSVATKGLPTSQGTGALRDFKPADDALAVRRLLAQGAIVMGKTNMHELSFGWTSNNGIFGPVRNPYGQDRVPGGSSGGSAVAVAARMAPLAVAEDTLGSIRVPASCCGLAGLRPTFGRYPDDGIMPLTIGKFDQVGPLARSVADLALFDLAVTGDSKPVSAVRLKGVRIGVAPYLWAGLDSEVERVNREALRKMRDAGAILVEAEIPEVAKLASDIAFAIIGYETMASIAAYLKSQGTGLSFEQVFAGASEGMQGALKALAMPPNRPAREVYESMLAKREELKEAIRRHYQNQGIVALAFPAILTPPPKIGEEVEVEIAGQKVPLYVVMGRNASLGSCVGMASLVLPAGFTSSGLPIGFELDALPGKDRDLLSLGLSVEREFGVTRSPNL